MTKNANHLSIQMSYNLFPGRGFCKIKVTSLKGNKVKHTCNALGKMKIALFPPPFSLSPPTNGSFKLGQKEQN